MHPPWATAFSQFRDSAVLGDSRFLARVLKLVSNLNTTGSGVELATVELSEAGRAPDDDALAVAPVVELDAAGLGAPSVEAWAVAPARLAVDLAPPRWARDAVAEPPGVEAREAEPPGVEALAREAAARARRALLNFHRLARTAIATLVFSASTAIDPPKFLDRSPDARPDQQPAAVFAASFLAVSARKRKVFLPTAGAGCLANAATNLRRLTPTTVGSASRSAAAAPSMASSRRRA